MSERWMIVRKVGDDEKDLVRARWCDSVLCRLRGLTFRRKLADREGLILVEPLETRMGTSIHMMGVFFSLGVVWVNSRGMVVDVRLARPGGFYFPRAAARFVLEAEPALLDEVGIGDFLELIDEETH